MQGKALTVEVWREYDIPGRPEPYRITSPKQLFVDNEDIIHCVPFPGYGTVLRWCPRDSNKSVAF